MAEDKEWAAVYEVVLSALVDDVDLLGYPLKTPQDVEAVAETVTDHVVGKFRTEGRA